MLLHIIDVHIRRISCTVVCTTCTILKADLPVQNNTSLSYILNKLSMLHPSDTTLVTLYHTSLSTMGFYAHIHPIMAVCALSIQIYNHVSSTYQFESFPFFPTQFPYGEFGILRAGKVVLLLHVPLL